MAMLSVVFGIGSIGGDERNQLDRQVQHRHAEKDTANAVDEYVDPRIQENLLRISLLLTVAGQGPVSSRNGLAYSIAAEGQRGSGSGQDTQEVRASHPCMYLAAITPRQHRQLTVYGVS